MAINRGFAYAYGWNDHYEKLFGMWTIKDEAGFIANQRAWAGGFLILIFLWIPQIASLPIIRDDLTAMIDSLRFNATFSIAMIKIIVLQYRRKVISLLLVAFNDDWGRASSDGQLEVMLETGRISRFISMMSFGLTCVGLVEWFVLQLWNMTTDGKDPDVDPRLSHNCPFVLYYPFNTTRRSVFVSVWLVQILSAIFAAMCYAAPDCLVSMLVLHVCGQLRIIGNSLKNIVNDTRNQEAERYWEKLAVIVKRHEQINEMAIAIKNTFSMILLIQLLLSSVNLCFQAFLIFMNFVDRNNVSFPILDVVFSTLYAVYTVMHLFLYCYVGDKLLVESTSLANDFYEADWYNLPPEQARAFLLVCHRSKTPLEISAGKFFTLNLQLFNSVLKNSMGYFSMLVAMKEKFVD